MEEEIWRDVKDYEGIYQVSNLGRVKSLPKLRMAGHNPYITEERVLKRYVDCNDYPVVSLCNIGIQKCVKVHLLVAIAFLNHIPNRSKIAVDHINGERDDNRLENLRIVTNRFNNSEGFRKNKNLLSSKYSGVHWHKNLKKWASTIRINGKQKHLGYFIDEMDAAIVYQNELLKLNETI